MTLSQRIYYYLLRLLNWLNGFQFPKPEQPKKEDEEKTETMADFNQAYQIVKRWEGGYTDNPNDRGNYNSRGELVGTNFGIAAFVYEDVIGRPPTASDMRNITQGEAAAIFRTRFWDRIKADLIFDQSVANIFFDGAVNHGTSRGTKLLQEVLGITQDGIVGPQTLNAINMGDSRQIFNAYQNRRRDFYDELIDVNPRFEVFRDGWRNRINSFNYVPGVSPPIVTNPSTGTNNAATIAVVVGIITLLYINR